MTYTVSTYAGPVSATAGWPGGTSMNLSVECPGPDGAQSRSGGPGVEVSTTSQTGSCYVVLTEPAGGPASISYSLTMQYQAG